MQTYATMRNITQQKKHAESDMTEDSQEPLLTISQLAEKLQVTRETIRRMRKAGKIKEYRIGASIRFKLSEVLARGEEDANR